MGVPACVRGPWLGVWCVGAWLASGCADGTATGPGVTAGMAEPPSASVVTFWRGFEHEWTHNHRWNRFGNWVSRDPDCPAGHCWSLNHAAASGTSADTAQARTHVTYGALGDLGFVQRRVTTTFALQMAHPSWRQTGVMRIELADLPPMQADALREQSLVGFLNGFDVYATDGSPSAKPIDFSVAVDDVRWSGDGEGIDVQWSAYLMMGCSSEECALSPEATYAVEFEVGVLGSPSPMGIARTSLHHRYGWDAPRNLLGSGKNPDAVELRPKPVRRSVKATEVVTTPVPVMTRLSMHLFRWDRFDKPADQHMVGWRSVVDASKTLDGTVDVAADLLFKNWVAQMGRHQVFAYEEVGAADMKADITVLNFPNPTTDAMWLTHHEWGGKEAPADGQEAVTSMQVRRSEGT